MESQQEENSSSYNQSSSATHTPAVSPIPPSFSDIPTNTFSNSTDFNQLTSGTGAQQLFNNQFDFAGVNATLFQDSLPGNTTLNFDRGNSQSFPDFVNYDSTALANDYDGLLFTPADQSFNSDLVDPSLLETQLSPHSVLDPMATSQAPTPPHLLPPSNLQHHISPHGSPSMQNAQYNPPSHNHSRHTSLDPSSAAFPQAQMGGHMGIWGESVQFQGHRRALSDAHSDISSAHASPYMNTADDFNQPGHSPSLQPQQMHDPVMFEDVMGLGGVSLSQASPSYMTPSHSPHISPSISPNHQADTLFPQMGNYNFLPSMGSTNQFGQPGVQGMPLQGPAIDYTNISNAPLATDDPNRSDAMSPPEISIQFAPPSRQASFEPQNRKNAANSDALALPEKPSRGRAKSDPFSSRGSGPSRDLLSPHAAGVGSRSPSPSSKSRRSSTSSVPNRDYILDLADPTRPTSTGSDAPAGPKRTQKHPANFQCSLCPKRFTRAYNLRSHLRTHTDERPFVCSHCGKAFARQHDRKRHEGLHSGEKKFVCRGNLKDGNNWGCGRRFARADALGRHFRSEAGRVCIKPLMDEEARERDLQNPEPGSELGISIMPLPNQGIMDIAQSGFAYNGSNPGGFQSGIAVTQMPMRLPIALLQQYPTLGGIWDSLPASVPDEIDDGTGHRNSFDASSAGELDEDDKWINNQGSAYGWASDVGP